MTDEKCCCKDAGKCAVRGLGVVFGIWLGYIGLMKWINGPAAFIGYISSAFAKTWAPAPLVTLLGWVIIIAEVVLGIWLISGFRARLAWFLTALYMFMLTFGETMLGDYAVVSNNWHYVVLALVAGALSCCKKEASASCA